MEAFGNYQIAGFARVIIVNLLHTKLPKLTLVVCCTCNCFDAAQICQQQDAIDRLWIQECLQFVGPVIGHASDRDSHRRQLMLHDYGLTTENRFRVDWNSWMFSTSLYNSRDIQGLHDQDFIHNGKKLINPLDSPVCVLQLGFETCFLEHVGHIYSKFSIDQYGLNNEDITRIDRQNWANVQRLCQAKARKCLAELCNLGNTHQERKLGTKTYLACVLITTTYFCPALQT